MSDPWVKWFFRDWRSDLAVRSCSLSARGLWHEMLGLMHDAEPYGHLIVAGQHPSPETLAVLIGVDKQEVIQGLKQLETAGVFSRTDEGVIFSRRMVRDMLLKRKKVACGRLGGNPALLVDKRVDNHEDKPSRARDQKPEARRKKGRARGRAFDPVAVVSEFPSLDTPAVRAALDQYLLARKPKHGLWTEQGLRLGLKKLQAGTPAEAVQAFEAATEGPWQTVWPVDAKHNGGPRGSAKPSSSRHIPDKTDAQRAHDRAEVEAWKEWRAKNGAAIPAQAEIERLIAARLDVLDRAGKGP